MDLIGINRTDLNTIVDKLSEYEKGLLDKFVTKLETQKMGKKMMVCHLTCANGFEVMGEAGCEYPAKFVFLLGYEYSLKDALRKLAPHSCFARAEMNYLPGYKAPVTEDQIERTVIKALAKYEKDRGLGLKL